MNEKHVPVTDMTFGQLYDAVSDGGIFFIDGDKIRLYDSKLESNNAHQRDISKALLIGFVKRLVEIPWTDQLDGTWGNGVWCMAWDNGDIKKCVAKISKYDECDYITNAGSYFHNAKPLPKHLADELEALSKEQSK